TIHLVEHQNLLLAHILHARKQCFCVLVQTTLRIEKNQNDVGILRSAPSRCDHGAVEPALWAENTGRVHQNDLRWAFDEYATHESTCRLHFVRNDGNLCSHKL